MALQYHPDKNGGDDNQFKKINEAYQILSDPDKRKVYDLKYEDDINLDILNTFATLLMNIVQEKLRDKLKQTSMFPKEESSKLSIPPITLKIAVDLEDIYYAKVKKLMVKVRRKHENEIVFKSIPLYISLLNYETSYVFKYQGDENDNGQKGDIIVNLDIRSEHLAIDTLFSKYDLHKESTMSLYDYLYGLNKSIKHFDKIIDIQKEPEELHKKDCVGVYTYEVENNGLPYVENQNQDEDEEVKRGKLYIHFKLNISEVPRDVLLDYENIFKTYFNS